MKNTKNISALTLPQVSTETRGRAFVFADFFNMEKKIEIWKDVVGYEGFYEVSNFGRVMSLNYNKTKKRGLMVGFTTNRKYKRILLSKKGVHQKHSVHRLVLEAFVVNDENKPYVNHLDGNPSNNHIDNLEWCTESENNLHAYRVGLMCAKGENNGQSKLTERDVLNIRAEKSTHREIGDKYGVSTATITLIKRGKLWGHIGGKITIERVLSKRLNSEIIISIFNSPKRPVEISKETGISYGVVRAIKKGERYCNITSKI